MERHPDTGLAALWTPDGVHELRIPDAGRARTISGYFDSPDKMAAAAARLDRDGHPGIYLTINPVNPDLLARSANQAKPYAKTTTSDRDITHRRWLVIDLDPVRPADIPSSDPEHHLARAKAVDIDLTLQDEGWPAPIYMDSGNGAYLLYRIDLPNTPEAADLLHRCLAALDRRFGDDRVKIDQTMYNAARIIRVPGTTNRKGTGIPERRPHRVAKLLDLPAELEPVDPKLLDTLAGPPKPPPAPAPRTGIGPTPYDPGRMLALVGRYRGPKLKEGSQVWELEVCPFNRDHARYESVIIQRADGAMVFTCPHNHCEGNDWAALRAMLDPKPEPGPKRRSTTTPANTRTQPREAEDGQTEPVGDPTPPLALSTQLDLFGGEEPVEFWGQRPILRHIHEAARASMTSPWAVLGRVLVRVVAATPPWLVLPPIVGREASLNLYVVAVDPSGGGKSSAADVGEQALAGANGYVERPVGSGEGLVSLFMRARRVSGNEWTVEQHNTAAILTADEIGSLLAQEQRNGATLGSFLRTGWTGRQLGAAYRDRERNLVVGAHRYRLCLWAGAQPGLCGPLLAPVSVAAGTPQRMVYLPAVDPTAPDETPAWPTPLVWHPPRWGDDPAPGAVRTIPVCATAREQIRAARRAQLRGQGSPDPLDGHALLNREKIAAALGLLDGRMEVSEQDWELAGTVMRVSDQTRRSIQHALAQELARAAKGKAFAKAQEALEVADKLEQRQLQKARRAIMRKLDRQPDGDLWVTHRQLRMALDSSLRGYFDEALQGLIETGLVHGEEVTVSANTTMRYRRS